MEIHLAHPLNAASGTLCLHHGDMIEKRRRANQMDSRIGVGRAVRPNVVEQRPAPGSIRV